MIEKVENTVKIPSSEYTVVKWKTSDGREFDERHESLAREREEAYQKYKAATKGKIFYGISDEMAHTFLFLEQGSYAYIEHLFWFRPESDQDVEDLDGYFRKDCYSFIFNGHCFEIGEWNLVILAREEGSCRDSYYTEVFPRSKVLEILNSLIEEVPGEDENGH